MSRTFLTNLDLAQNQLLNARIQNLGSEPSTPVKGQIYFNDTSNTLFWYDGSGWVSAVGGAGAFPGYGASTAVTTFGAAKADGSGTTVSRSDHTHGSPTHDNAAHSAIPLSALSAPFGASTAVTTFGAAKSDGAGTSAARNDHTHGTPSLGTTSTTAAAGDHGHALTDAAITGTLATAKGGTNNAGPYVVGGIMYASATTTLDDSAVGTAGQTLLSGGAGAPTWGFPSISSLVQPSADVPWNAKKITGLADGTNANDAVNKSQLDTAIQGLDAKQSVRLASTANLGLTGLAAIDGVTPIAGDRILAKNQTTTSQNGIYTAASGAWTRATDMDTWAEVPDAFTWVEQGSLNADTGWVCTTVAGGVIGTNPITWTQFSGAGQISAGTGMTKSGSVLDVVANSTGGLVANADDIAIKLATSPNGLYLGATGVGVSVDSNSMGWNGNAVAFKPQPSGGLSITGTGVTVDPFTTTVKGAVPAPGSATGKFLKDDATWAAVPVGTVVKYATDVGGSTAQVITHSLNTRDVQVEVYRNSTPWDSVECDVERTSTTTCTLRFAVAPGAAAYRVVVTA